MHRGGKPYYSYKDTVMSKLSPFRPEWIEELVVVKDNKPTNTNVNLIMDIFYINLLIL